jgi:predicted nucleic acid-binding protein
VSEPVRRLVDTSAWIETLRKGGDASIRETVTELTHAGTAVVCPPVLVELWNGAGGDAETQHVQQIERYLASVPITPAVWEIAKTLARDARRAGLTIPVADLVIFACAEHHGLGLVHDDDHFVDLARLRSKSPARPRRR